METVVTLSSKFLNKYDDSHKPEYVIKLLEAGTKYLVQWYNGISTYITKSSKKFEHLNGLLEEVPHLSDDDSDYNTGGTRSRRSSHRDSTRVQSPVLTSGGKNRNENEKQASRLVNILKNQENREGTYENILDNSFNELDGSNVMVEAFNGKEVNGMGMSILISLIRYFV